MAQRMPFERSGLAYAILASLDLAPMTGYDLKKFFDRSVGHFWSTTQSHIYKSLEDLQARGWTTVTVIPQQDKPNRKQYELTTEGRSELRRWLTTPQPPAPVRESWLIQIFFSHTSTDEEISALLEERGRRIKEILQTYEKATGIPEQIPPGLERASKLWRTTLDYGLAFYRFELEWNGQMLRRVKDLPQPELRNETR